MAINKSLATITPASNEDVHAYHELRRRFHSSVLDRIQHKSSDALPRLPNLSDFEVRGKIEAMKPFFGKNELPSHLRRWKGAVRYCLTSDELPGVLFKRKITLKAGETMADYKKVADKARDICKTRGLTVLYIPQCEVVNFDPTILMEERISLVSSDAYSIEALYEWMYQDEEMSVLAKEALRELAVVTCELKYADLKFDNAAWMWDARVGLFDVDEKDQLAEDGVLGLTSSTSCTGNGGLFSFIPPQWFDSAVLMVNNLITAPRMSALLDKLPKLKAKSELKSKRITHLRGFYEKNGLISPRQPLSLEGIMREGLFNTSNVFCSERLVKRIVAHLNLYIERLDQISLTTGRQAILDIQIFKSEFEPRDSFKEQTVQALTFLIDHQFLFAWERVRRPGSDDGKHFYCWMVF